MLIHAAAYHSGKHLSEEELLPVSTACPWCGYNGRRNAVLGLQRNPEVTLLACPQCHAFSASRNATDSALDRYYSSYFPESAGQRVTCGSPRRHARHILRLAKVEGAAISILDFGGGDGSIGNFVGKLLSRPVKLMVVDHNQRLAEPENPFITISHSANLDQVSGRFDLVLAGAVLEHLPEPAGIARRLLLALHPGGFFYARTPCVAPMLKLFSRAGLPYDFTFPAHFHDLGERFWNRIVSTLALDSEEWRIVASRPSLVETAFSEYFLRTAAAYLLKAPWWILRSAYPFTGGWEVVIRRSR